MVIPELPGLQHNFELKQTLLEVAARGKASDADLEEIRAKAKNLSAEEDRAIEVVLGKVDVFELSSEAKGRFDAYRAQESVCRTNAQRGWLRRALVQGTGSLLATGAAGAAFAAVGYPDQPWIQLLLAHLTAIGGAVYGFANAVKNGPGADYGVED